MRLISERRDANAAEIVRRKGGLVERLYEDYALKEGNYRQTCGEFLSECFQRVAAVLASKEA